MRKSTVTAACIAILLGIAMQFFAHKHFDQSEVPSVDGGQIVFSITLDDSYPHARIVKIHSRTFIISSNTIQNHTDLFNGTSEARIESLSAVQVRIPRILLLDAGTISIRLEDSYQVLRISSEDLIKERIETVWIGETRKTTGLSSWVCQISTKAGDFEHMWISDEPDLKEFPVRISF